LLKITVCGKIKKIIYKQETNGSATVVPLVKEYTTVVPLLSNVFYGGNKKMSTDKPQLKTYIETKYYNKFKVLAEEQNRSISNYIEYLVKKEIDQYEQEHGEIIIKNEQ